MKLELVLVSLTLLIFCQTCEANEPKPEWHLKQMAEWKERKDGNVQPRHIYDTSAAKSHSGKFAPSGLRCCKLGEKIARKQLSCDAHHYHPEAVSGPGNEHRKRTQVVAAQAVRQLMKKLSPKIERCTSSKYSNNLSKCCAYRQHGSSELEACKRHLRKVDRRRCRKTVRKNFP